MIEGRGRDSKGRFVKGHQCISPHQPEHIKKVCLYCGKEYSCSERRAKRRVTCGAKECQKEHNKKLMRDYKKIYIPEPSPVPNPQNLGKCPFLKKCFDWSGIDCRERDHTTCNFYKVVVRERKKNA